MIEAGRRLAGAGSACLLAVLLAGCVADTNAAVGPVLPPAVPRLAVGAAAADEARLAAGFGGEYRAPVMKALLSDVVARLVPKTERPDESYAVTILDAPVVNAFALPSGHLYVTRGLLALAGDEAEVAAVMAHEIAHVTQRHALARGELEARSVLVSRVMSDVLDRPSAGALVRDRSRATLAGFSRAQEFEADEIGVRTIAAAGYDPHGAARFLATLGRNAEPDFRDPDTAARERDMFATHPGTPERIAAARSAARRIGAPGLGTGGRDAYLAALDGVAYGDNPADGQVRGRRFLHPRLGVAFEAPDGFALENTAQAVLGGTADGRRRLLFDAVEPTDGQGLGDLLASSWAEALDAGSLRMTELDGRPTAVAASRGDAWTFRLAAVKVGATTYRLIMGERGGAASLDRDFAQTLATLRDLGRDEAAGIRPKRIALATAAAGDTAEGLSARMATDRPLERFLVLNGLERDAALRPGERYKLVVE